MNQITLYGRVGNDPETQTINATTLTKLSLATSERYKDKSGEKVEKTQWHSLALWGKVGEIAAEYVKKGDALLVTGSVEYNTSGEGNDKKYYTSVRVKDITLMPRQAGSNSKPEEPRQSNPETAGSNKFDDSDLPF